MTGNYCDDDPNAEKFRKLFIGGLNNETTEDTLRQYFETWGEVVDCVVMKNPTNNRSRGFGFVTYQSAAQLDKAQAQRPHTLDKKTLDTKRAMPRDGSEETQASVKKMFVGGLEETTSEEEIRELFCPYGRIEKVEMIKDKATDLIYSCILLVATSHCLMEVLFKCLLPALIISGEKIAIRASLYYLWKKT
ncbi:heterogeneous nuclear ribonucleoproteins A2/B1-like [Octopus bimaculoides]|uniref:heterogeneous nuclear ribonucleoproteins A2/B1-like n=1 Tax=Octopus bimaculoides TaxID=37653 RepID=UPI0022E1D96A|nr:heterogeneous nuclear ribonucleoproteins A2/B1-like [Octopus bimaculoides]